MEVQLYNKIVSDAIAGPSDITSMSATAQYYLLGLYNKRYIEFIIEYGQKFELYVGDYTDAFEKLRAEVGGETESLGLIEQCYMYSPISNFLYASEIVSKKEIRVLRTLIQNGYIHVFPLKKHTALIELYYGEDDDSDVYLRDDLSGGAILLNIPNTLNLKESDVSRHFVEKTPQCARYSEIIKKALDDPKSLRLVNDVYYCLAQLDNVANTIQENINKAIDGDDVAIEWFQCLLNYWDCSETFKTLSELEKSQFMQWNMLNMNIGWIFNCKKLDKQHRIELLELLMVGGDAKTTLLTLKEKGVIL